MNQERIAQRLLRSSASRSYDPQVDIDWRAPIDEDKLYFPTRRLPLYGTPLWESLSPEQRIEVARQEAITLSSVIIHAE
ncbi:diiron oxygenase, partial [Amycolatopsis vastitatis]